MDKNITFWGPVGVLMVILAAALTAEGETATFEGRLVCSKCYLADNSLINNYHFPMKVC